jgi:D-aminoacyl-tRNA deacylase
LRAVVQRVKDAELKVEGTKISSIDQGLLVYLGVTHDDIADDIDWLVKKVCNLRIFDDSQGVMNLSAIDLGLQAMVVSQFTLYASTKKGNRPSYLDSAPPAVAVPLYEAFVKAMQAELQTVTGVFGADMHITYTNQGPVTILIDTKRKE